jgi:hypothetical protein
MNPVEPDKPSRRRDLMNRVEPDNEFTQWRLRSRSCGVADMIAATAAISLYAVAGIDNVVSWPSNQVLLSDPDLVRIAIVLLAPTLVWLIVSAGMVYGRIQTWRLSQLPARPRTCLVAAAVVCAAVIFVGLLLGTAKGAVRILPGPRYQVSLIGNSQTAWTTVPLSQFRLWQASFVREDGFFMFFGLLAATCFIALLDLRRSYRVSALRLVSSIRTRMTPPSMNAPPVKSRAEGVWPSSSHAYSTAKNTSAMPANPGPGRAPPSTGSVIAHHRCRGSLRRAHVHQTRLRALGPGPSPHMLRILSM